ncbi:MAG: hypothetical protein JXL67_08765 [Calditrichaeota bacterium]|nr:hypothetical protein [Calditrichota bacterium]
MTVSQTLKNNDRIYPDYLNNLNGSGKNIFLVSDVDYEGWYDYEEKYAQAVMNIQLTISGSSYVEDRIQDNFLSKVDAEYQIFPKNLLGTQSVWEFEPFEPEYIILEEIKRNIREDKIELARKNVAGALKDFPNSERINRIYKVLQPPKVLSTKLPARKSSEKEIKWLRENGSKYAGNWVALYDENLLACDPKLKIVLREAKKRYPLKDVLVHFIPK